MRDEARTREERDRDQHKVQEEPGRQTERRGCLHSNREPRSLAVASVSGLSLSWDTVGYLPVAKLGPLGELPNDVDDFRTYS